MEIHNKRKKKLLLMSIIIVFIFIFSLINVSAEIIESGTCGENLTWALDDEGKLTINGTGDMDTSLITWYSSGEQLKTVEISYGVTSIDACAFIYCSSLESIEIPESVTNIGEYAFNYCSGLESIEIPESVMNIGEYAFSGCENVKEITFGENSQLMSIGESAFNGCSRLTNIEIPASVTSIGDGAVWGCSSLETVTFEENSQLMSFGEFLFNGCASLKSIEIPASVTSIGTQPFYECSSLETVTFGENSQLMSIGEYAFDGCSRLKSIEIPASVTSIGDGAVGGCSSLETVIFEENSKLTSIGKGAFGYCSSLERIELPASVTIIWEEAFKGCEILNTVTFEEDSQLTSIGNNAFYECSGLETVTFEEDSQLTSIGNGAFGYCSCLANIDIPSRVTSIGSNAFYQCSSLESVTFEEDSQLTSIENGAFLYCTGLETVTFGESSHLMSIGDGAFERCSGLMNMEIPASVTTIGEWAFEGCEILNTVTFGENSKLTGIGACAFLECYELVSIEIPESVTSIGEEAFYRCSNIKEITFGNNSQLMSIGDRAFLGCSSLVSIEIPAGVTRICEATFSGCSSLVSVAIPLGVTSIGRSSFKGCSSLVSVVIPMGVARIEFYTFENCSSLTSIAIPISLTSIEDGAFNQCSLLKDVYYEGAEEQWSTIDDTRAFYKSTIHYNSYMSTPEAPVKSEFSFNTTNSKVYGLIGATYLDAGTVDNNGNIIVGGRLYVTLKSDEYTLADITWNVSDESIFKITSIYDGPVENSQTIDVETLKKGVTTLTASLPDGTVISVDVEIINANNIELTEKYAPEYRYCNGSFLSNNNDLSTTPEIYIAIKNSPRILYDFEENEDVNNLHNLKISASVSGNNLSFDKYSYKNSYESLIKELRLEESLADLLLFYPYNVGENTFATEKKFDVTLSITADELDAPYTETISFTVENYKEDAASLNIEKHLQFINNNPGYQRLKNNDAFVYAERINNSWDYRWNDIVFNMISIENILFDDINDLVVADIISEYIASPMYEHFGADLLIKTFAENYEQALLVTNEIIDDAGNVWSSLPDHIDKMVLNEYVDTEMKLKLHTIDKLLKISKYSSTGTKFKDQDFFTHVNNCLKNAPNAQGKINAVFSTLDKAGVAWDVAGMIGDISNHIIDGVNYTTILNAYYGADEAKRNTINHLLGAMLEVNSQVPGFFSKECLEAVERYVLTENEIELIAKNVEIWMHQGKKMAYEVYNGIFKDYVRAGIWSVVGAIKVTVSGGSKVAFASSTGASVGSGLLFGWIGGKCVSNILCNSEDKASEMANAVILGKISLAAKGVLMFNEAEVINSPTEQNIEKFEQSLELFKIIQSQSIKHLIEINKAKAFSLIEIIFTDREHQVVEVNNALESDRKFYESIVCHGDNVDAVKSLSPVTESVKVIQIKCPVNVCLYSLDDELLVQITDNQVVFEAEGVVASVYDETKYVIIPAEQQFKIEINANESGSMNYSVTEYNQGETIRKVNFNDISLYEGQSFNGNLNSGYEISEESYALNTADKDNNQEVIYHSEVYSGSQIQKLSVNVICIGDGEARGVNGAICGDYVVVAATPNDDAEFEGWYDASGNVVSTNTTYGFIIRESIELIAKFKTYINENIDSYRCTIENEVVEDTTFSCDVYFSNDYNKPSAVVIVAFYDNDNRLVQMALKPVDVKAGKVDVSMNYESKPYSEYKVMVWESLGNLKPLMVVK